MEQKYRRDHEMVYQVDEALRKEQLSVKRAVRDYNQQMPFDYEAGLESLRRVGIHFAGKIYLEPPFYCEYGNQITVGKDFYANTGCVMLDVGRIVIGDHVMFGPNVSIYTAGHPLHADSRNSGWEYGIGVTIGNSVWIGGQTVLMPGVTIGDRTVIGAGSVVTKDIPSDVVAAGNPCRVIREITEEDRPYYYKDRKFDAEVWALLQKGVEKDPD